MRGAPRRRLRGSRPLRGLHHDECQTLQKQVEGLHHLSAARTQLGRVAHEEGRVAAQLGGVVDQLRLRKPQVEERVDRPQHGPCRRMIRRPDPPERDALHQPDRNPLHAVAALHEPEGLHADVLLRGAVHRNTLRAEHGAAIVRTEDFHLVAELRDGKHHRLEIVVAVRTPAQDVEPQIYFYSSLAESYNKR